jgi:hypothetical protein
MSILINPIKPCAGMSHTHPLRRSTCRSTPSQERPLLATSVGLVLAHVPCCVTTHVLTPAMHTMPAQLRPHALVKPRVSSDTKCNDPPPRGRAHLCLASLFRTPRISPQTNTCLSCALYPHSCALGKDFPVGDPLLQVKHA